MQERHYTSQFRTASIVEIALFLIVTLALDAFFFEGNRFWGVEPHPFWIIILLMSAQYGTAEGVLAAILSSVALLLGNMPEQTIRQDMYEYLLYVVFNPLMWLVAGIVFGELRQRHVRERNQMEQELEDAHEREDEIAEAYDKVRSLKEKLELRIAGQLRASVNTYRAAQAIEKLNPDDVLRGVQELITSVLGPDKFSIYLLSSEGLQITTSYGWEESNNYSRKFDANSSMYREVIGGQKILCVANSDHEKILADQGLLAGPMMDKETGEIVGMLKLEDVGFTDLNLSTIDTFAAICEWVGAAFINARSYQSAKADSMVDPERKLFTSNYFTRYTDYITALAKRQKFDVNMINVRMLEAEQLSASEHTKAARLLAEATDSLLRSVDLAFDYHRNEDEYSVVLPATDKKGADIVVQRLEAELRSRLPKNLKHLNFSFSVHTLHDAA